MAKWIPYPSQSIDVTVLRSNILVKVMQALVTSIDATSVVLEKDGWVYENAVLVGHEVSSIKRLPALVYYYSVTNEDFVSLLVSVTPVKSFSIYNIVDVKDIPEGVEILYTDKDKTKSIKSELLSLEDFDESYEYSLVLADGAKPTAIPSNEIYDYEEE